MKTPNPRNDRHTALIDRAATEERLTSETTGRLPDFNPSPA